MKFSALAKYFEEIENTSSRLAMTNLLAELFKKLNPQEIEKTVYLLQGRVLPLFSKVEFGMAERMIVKSILVALSLDKSYFDKEFKKFGDLGKTVEYFKKQYSSFEERDLDILVVYEELYRLAVASGEGSQETKTSILANLIRQLDPLSTRYLVRIPQAVLRLGFSDMTVLDAYSWMIKGDKSLRSVIEKSYHVRPDLGLIGRLLKEKNITGLSKIEPSVFTPIIMMRAERLSSGEEIVKQIGQCAIESKYDGFRLQIHYKKTQNSKLPTSSTTSQEYDRQGKNQNAEVRLYSRNLEEVSAMYPDIIQGIKDGINADELIIEGEAIGYDPQTGNLLPFQETVQRKRKYDISEKAKEIPLKLFVFELLYCDGKNYIHLPFVERRKKLETVLRIKDKKESIIILAPENITTDAQKIELQFEEAIAKGLEGIIAKKLDGIYQPGARGWNWIKFKRSYSSKIEDTIDCLVMGYDLGKGKRTGFGIGAFLVGIYDDKNDKFVTMAKIGTGLTDEEWKELRIKSKELRIKNIPANYLIDPMMNCDVWISPKIVVEIKADEITRSPVHTAGRVMKASKSGKGVEVEKAGYALRFPRLEKFRDDKNLDDITTLKEVEKMYQKQKK